MFDREIALEWINSTLTSELKHYYALDDSSKIGIDSLDVGCTLAF